MMPMMSHKFRLRAFDEPAWRVQLRAEVGKRRSSARNVETGWTPGSDSGVLHLLSQDPVALVYAAKLCLAMGGENVGVGGRTWAPPAWAIPKWVEIPWTTKLRLWIGPTKFYSTSGP